MALWYLAVTVAVISSYAVQRAVIPRLGNALSVEVIFGVEHRKGSLPPVFAHRGGAHEAPENTLAAFREAKRNNASGVEFDLSFTQDSVAVLFHDDTLERTTDGEGSLASVTFEASRRLDASCKHPLSDKFKGERVPILEEGVKECLQLGLRLIIDVKEYGHRAVKVVDDLFRQRPVLYKRTLVAAFYPHFIYALRCQSPNIVTALTWRSGSLAYEDMQNQQPRFQSRIKR
ncbi:hypothetical protein V5799_029243 [Amblyomma americanum]|uniref:GP-PDE domain-containing protein n=1 Tax=Amblyomma americanum TaxID=6943 RepID=A0AAQ4ERQ1_AMBAM